MVVVLRTRKKKDPESDSLPHLHTPTVIARRAATYSFNTLLNLALEESRQWKEEHLRPKPKIQYVEKIVHVKAQRRLPTPLTTFNVDLYLSTSNQQWLRQFLRKEANTSSGRLFLPAITAKTNEKCSVQFDLKTMALVLHDMGFQYGILRKDYYYRAAHDPYNISRRDLIVPVQYYCLTTFQLQGKICVIYQDETNFWVNDEHSSGWFDTTQPVEERSTGSKPGRGPRLQVSAFFGPRGILHRKDGNPVGMVEWSGVNNFESMLSQYREIGAVLQKEYPSYFCLIVTDSPRTKTRYPDDAVIPKRIIKGEGGKYSSKRYGNLGLAAIFEKFFPDVDVTGWKVADFRKYLSEQQFVKDQLLALEEAVRPYCCAVLFNPIATAVLNAIELLWREIKFDYRVNWKHTKPECETCVRAWISNVESPLGSADYERYVFNGTFNYVSYYIRGGTGIPKERDLKMQQKSDFVDIENGDETMKRALSALYERVPDLPRSVRDRKCASGEQFKNAFSRYLHELNYMRINKPLQKRSDSEKVEQKNTHTAEEAAEDGSDSSSDVEEDSADVEDDSDVSEKELGNEAFSDFDADEVDAMELGE